MGGWQRQDRGCARAREWASQRADQELSELERLLLRRHLGRCHECSAFAASIEAAAALMRASAHEEPERSLAPELPTARPREGGRRRRQLAIAVALVAVSGAVGGVVGGLLRDGDEKQPVITIVEVDPGPTPAETQPAGDV